MFFALSGKRNPMKLIPTLLFILCSAFSNAAGILFQDMGFEQAKALAINKDKELFIDFYIDGCAPCKYLTDQVFIEQELGEFMNEHYISIRMNLGLPENRIFKSRYGIDSYPTMLFFDKNYKLIRKIEGSKEASVLLEIAKNVTFPEKSVLYGLHQEYNKGRRDKGFLQLYIKTLKENDSNVVNYSREFAGLYELDLNEKEDLQMVYNGNYLADSKYIIQLFDKINLLHMKYPELVKRIVKQLINETIKVAVEQRDYSIIEKFIPNLLPVYIVAIDSTMTLERLSKTLRTKFEDRAVWGDKKFVMKTDSAKL